MVHILCITLALLGVIALHIEVLPFNYAAALACLLFSMLPNRWLKVAPPMTKQVIEASLILMCSLFLYRQGVVQFSLIVAFVIVEIAAQLLRIAIDGGYTPILGVRSMHLHRWAVLLGILYLVLVRDLTIYQPMTLYGLVGLVDAIFVAAIVYSIASLIRNSAKGVNLLRSRF